MIRRVPVLAFFIAALAALATAAPAGAIAPPCTEEFKSACFGIEYLDAELKSNQEGVEPNQAGAHPDLTFTFGIDQDPDSDTDVKGLHDVFAPTRNVRTELPPGFIGDPNALGAPQLCRAAELTLGECPNGSQIGVAKISLYKYTTYVTEPVYMMEPPGGDVIARVGLVGGTIGRVIYADATLRSESDYGLSVEIIDAPTDVVRLVGSETTLWGVPTDEAHDKERCTPEDVFLKNCTVSDDLPPGGQELPFITAPTRCGVPIEMRVAASSWIEPLDFDTESSAFPAIVGCNKLHFGAGLTASPTTRRAASPTGLDMTLTLPKAEGPEALEHSQIRDVEIQLPRGVAVNPASADGLGVCSVEDVRFGKREDAHCPESSKVAATEFEIGGLSRRMKGAIYLREPEPGNLFRVWVVADDLGAHVKLEGQLEIDESTGQITTVLHDTPQAPLRETKLQLKSGFRAPLMTPSACGKYKTHYELTPWSGGPPSINDASMSIDEGCDTGGFSPQLSAGATDSAGGSHSPFVATLTREDGEDNVAALDVTLPRGMSATFAGIPRCGGAAAETGQCPAESRIGKVTGATGVGRAPLWVPQPGKRPTAVYLAGPYKGAPLSIVAVVPAQAGPFDLGDQVVRSAVYVDPVTAEATTRSDPLPQMIEGVPVLYRTVNVLLDRPNFTLNPTSCARKATTSTIYSAGGKTANPSSPFAATGCGRLGFKPKLSLRLRGGTNRGAHPRLKATLKMPPGGANIAGTSVALPRSAFLDQAHIRTVCTRVQFKASECPQGSIYGTARAKSPLLDETLEGPVYLRSSNNPLPDVVVTLEGPPELPVGIELVGRVDSVNGGIRTTFDSTPDAPVSEFTLNMQGGKKGLIVNSTNLCAKVNRATAKFTAQNGKRATLHPPMKASCRSSKAAKR